MRARDDLLAVPDELLRNGSITEAVLCWMDFSITPKRWWGGFGPLEHAGHIWEGSGETISVSDLTTDYQMNADPVSFVLAATAEMTSLARANRERVMGRRVVVYSQLFATVNVALTDEGEEVMAAGPWQPLGQPMALFSGTMGPMTYSKKGASTRSISLQCEGLWARRNAAPRGLLTDRDQQARHPGDRGLERVGIYESYETRWI